MHPRLAGLCGGKGSVGDLGNVPFDTDGDRAHSKMHSMGNGEYEGGNQGVEIRRHGIGTAPVYATRTLSGRTKRSTGVAMASNPSTSVSVAISEEALWMA